MTTPDLLVVGHIRKAHGLKGEVVVRLTTNRAERVFVGAVLMAGGQELLVASSRPKDDDYLVMFEGVSSREAADALRGTELLAPPLDDPEELWIHELIGASVIDQGDVVRGRVVEVLANPASDLLVLDSDALVPATFIIDFDPENDGGVVRVDVPDGLFDL
jgi:16S rRNA processing protein RimM